MVNEFYDWDELSDWRVVDRLRRVYFVGLSFFRCDAGDIVFEKARHFAEENGYENVLYDNCRGIGRGNDISKFCLLEAFLF